LACGQYKHQHEHRERDAQSLSVHRSLLLLP
jgi:hypothetical protein